MRTKWWNRLQRAARPRPPRPDPRPTARLRLQPLEPREVPTASPFFLDSHGGLWGATDATAKLSRFTGLTGAQLGVGEVTGGGQFAVVRDAHNHVAIFNGNNDVATPTTVVARDVVAGRGEVFYRDGRNHVGVLTLGAALNPDGTFAVTQVPTDGTAVQMKLGYDTTTGQDFLAFRAPTRRVHVLEVIGGTAVRADAGVAGIDLEAGNQKETFVRRANYRVDVVTIAAATAAGITFVPTIATGKAALSLSVGRGSPVGDDVMAFRAPDGSAHYMRYTPGAATVGTVDLAGVFARQVVVGANEVFVRDRANHVRVFVNDVGGTTFTELTVPPVTAARLVVTRFSSVALPIDQVAVVTPGGQLLVSQNDAAGTGIASFYNTGYYVRAVAGFPENP